MQTRIYVSLHWSRYLLVVVVASKPIIMRNLLVFSAISQTEDMNTVQ